MKTYCCKEHIELALDKVVYESNLPPIMESVDNSEKPCEFCHNKAIYVVSE